MTEGIKYDSGKLRLAEMMQDFRLPLAAVCHVWEFGADKYEKSNWKKVDNAVDRYTNAMLRHLMEEEAKPFDDESELLHAAHVAWNAIARLYFIMHEKGLPIRMRPAEGAVGTCTPIARTTHDCMMRKYVQEHGIPYKLGETKE
jgi:hypothetical protein